MFVLNREVSSFLKFKLKILFGARNFVFYIEVSCIVSLIRRALYQRFHCMCNCALSQVKSRLTRYTHSVGLTHMGAGVYALKTL